MIKVFDYKGDEIRTPYTEVPWKTDMHRGYASATVHYNTLPAFHRAWLNGSDWIEADARIASDGVYVVCHDATITANGITYTIANETSETLTSLVLSNDSVYGECKLPTLESTLRLCLYTGMNCNLDCKSINATTLAKLVVDCGMSGRVYYANTSTNNAETILTIDPNAGFLFSYSSANLTTWANALPDYHIRQRTYAWSTAISNEALEATRALGFKYLLSEVDSATLMPYAPDCIEFKTTADCYAINQQYLDNLTLLG